MKIIFSRKGFDSSTGGFASPILPNGRIISMPIPEKSTGVSYSNLRLDENEMYYSLMRSLYGEKIKIGNQWETLTPNTSCHLDPDITKDIIDRADNWRGVFGQIDQAAGHLENENVQEGDVFLFFGWFQKTIRNDNKVVFDKNDNGGRHVLFGYLQVGEIIKTALNFRRYNWIGMHPHLCENRIKSKTNTLYLASEKLSFAHELSGYGRFRYSPELVLSKEGETKSKWALPPIFKETTISYHKNKNPWQSEYFQSVHKGQEFVLTASNEIKRWVQGIIERNVTNK